MRVLHDGLETASKELRLKRGWSRNRWKNSFFIVALLLMLTSFLEVGKCFYKNSTFFFTFLIGFWQVLKYKHIWCSLKSKVIKGKSEIWYLHPCIFYSSINLVTNLDMHYVQVNLCQKLFFLQNMGSTCCVQKLFWMSETISVHNMFSPGLSLEISCIELVIQWTICRHIVG